MPAGQSASAVHAPPPQNPPVPQSALVVHAIPFDAPVEEHPLHAFRQTGQGWMPVTSGRSGVVPFSRSPKRKIVEVSGRLTLDAPVSHCPNPVASVAMVLMTHVLSGATALFGIGKGGPNRHPTLVQFRLLPVSVDVRLLRVRHVPLHALTLVRLEPMSGTTVGSGRAS